MKVTTKTDIKEFPLLNRGKVRDIYDIDDSTLLIVTTDRMSAFDVIMNEPVPYKGVILNQITLFWMKKFAHLVKNHLIESDVDKFPAALAPYREELEGRSVLVKKAKPLPVECIVRGYITGSGWKDYKATGSVCGYKLPEGLLESARLEQPLFTPSTMKGGSIWRISPMNRERPFSSVRMGRPSTVVSCRNHKWACASMIV